MKVLILGHKGLLGNCLLRFLSLNSQFEIFTTNKRWPDFDFINFIERESFDWIINSIAAIPQSKPSSVDFFITNLALPVFLSSKNAKVIHASSDDLSGKTEYSLSKLCAEKVVREFPNSYIIRSSIIGVELDSSKSLLSWFLCNKNEKINGYTNHFWNGITTLEWAKLASDLLLSRTQDKIIKPFSDTLSKYEMLLLFKKVFEKKIEIVPTLSRKSVRENSDTNIYTGNLISQVIELKSFYKL